MTTRSSEEATLKKMILKVTSVRKLPVPFRKKTKFILEKNSMCVKSVVKPLGIPAPFSYMKEFILEKNPTSVKTVGKPLEVSGRLCRFVYPSPQPPPFNLVRRLARSPSQRRPLLLQL